MKGPSYALGVLLAVAGSSCGSGGGSSTPSRPITTSQLGDVRPTGTWATAASGVFDGHRWVQYVASGTHDGICTALDIDGRTAGFSDLLPPARTVLGIPGGIVEVPSLLYLGHFPFCGVFKPILDATGSVTYGDPVAFAPQQQATSTEPGYLVGVVLNGTSVDVTLDSGVGQEIALFDHTFTVFIPAARQVTGVTTFDSQHRVLVRCTVHVAPYPGGLSAVQAGCPDD